MVNSVYFILPPDKTMASRHVRGLCLDGFAPQGYEFKFISPDLSHSRFSLVAKLKNIFNYALTIGKIKKISNQYFYFVKPSSCALLILCRFVYRCKVIIDINDPIHLPEHLGRFSKIKFVVMLKVANAAVFESSEYEQYTRDWHKAPTIVIEDTPQFEMSFINYDKRSKGLVWFGSPATSKILNNYHNYFKKINSAGLSITLLGADVQVVKLMRESGIVCDSENKYSHELLFNTLSNALLSFIPMPNIESYSLRGNLKAKFSMAAGCITIASDLDMHKRLIENNVNGFLFSDFEDFSRIIDNIAISNTAIYEDMGRAANRKIMKNFNRMSHAQKLCKYFNSLN